MPAYSLPSSLWKVALASFIVITAWGSVFPFVSILIHHHIGAFEITSGRYVIAGIIMLPLLLITKRIPKHSWSPIILCGLIGIAGNSVLLNIAETFVNAPTASIVNSLEPVIVAIFGVVFAHNYFSKYGWIGSAIAILGVCLICLSVAKENITLGYGSFITIMAATCTAILSVQQTFLGKKYDGLTITGWGIIATGIAFAPWFGGVVKGMMQSNAVCAVFIWLSLISSILGYLSWGWLCKLVGVAKASIALYMLAPVSIIMSIFLENQYPSYLTLIGGGIILLGIAITRIKSKKHYKDSVGTPI